MAAPAAPASSTQAGKATSRVVTLITGDQVVLRTAPGGRQTVAVKPRLAQHHGFVTRRVGADLYVIPADAVPYLGRSLDMSLFDVSALLRDNPDGRIPVRVTYAAGAAQNAPAGVTFTGTGTASARDGYLTAAGARQFGAALDAQRARDAAAHWAGDRRLYGAVTSVRYAGAGPAPVAHPNFPMFTVKLPVLGLQGEPAPFGNLTVVNVDDTRKFVGFPFVVDGDVRVSLPAGHYSAQLFYPLFDADGMLQEARVAVTDFEVTGATSHTIDARTATSRVSFRTPRPADLQDVTVGLYRGSDDALAVGSIVGAGTAPLFVSPTPAAAAGVLHYYAVGSLSSPAGAATPYSYRAEYPSDGAIGANQRYVVTADSLATVRRTFYSEHQQDAGAAVFATLPFEFFAFASIVPVPTPRRDVQYLTANPQLIYQQLMIASLNDFGGQFFDGGRVYPQRMQVSQDWFRQPLAPGIAGDTGIGLALCDACRNGDLLSVFVAPVIDSTPDHVGFLDFPDPPDVVSTTRFQLLSGSTVLHDENDVTGGDFTVPAGSAPYKVVYDQTRQAPWFGLSPVSHTEWTFTSGHSGTNTVADRVFCDGDAGTCSALPLLTLNYQLGTSLAGTMPPGPASLRVTVGHAPFAAAVPVSAATVAVSFDGGKTWTPVSLRNLGAGAFQATWTNPASVDGGPVAIRVRATDAAGGTISQTVQAAFTITPGGDGA